MKSIIYSIAAIAYTLFINYLINLAEYYGLPYFIDLSILGFLLVCFMSSILFALFGAAHTILVMPLFICIRKAPSAKWLSGIISAMCGLYACALPWMLNFDYDLGAVFLGVSATIFFASIYIAIIYITFSADKQ